MGDRKKGREQAREEEEDELLQQVHLLCDTCGVWEQGDVDEMGVDEFWGREPDVILDNLLRGELEHDQPPNPTGVLLTNMASVVVSSYLVL